MDKFTEGILNRLDRDVKRKFGLSLNAVIDEPARYMHEKGFAVKLSRINDYVDKETEKMVEQAKGSSRAFHESASKSDELTRKISAYISSHARQNGIPLVQPADVELRSAGKNTFYLGDLDDSTSRFLEKLIGSSQFVVDMTKSYDSLRLGSWLFGGENECVVSVTRPRNSLLLLRIGRAEIMDRLKEAMDSIKGL
ncbi:MAG: hypothetical protein KGH94_01140 [Candidatus Micrarchaeota archaeon]|nr:hypothetical protein [Candidatus Micrarchaeota archaeon]